MNGPECGRIEWRFKGSARARREEIPQNLIKMIVISDCLHDQQLKLARAFVE